MKFRRHSLLLLMMLTAIAYGLRVIGAESSAIYAHDTQLVRQSLELGQRLLGNQSENPTQQTGTKYPLTFTLLLTGVFGATFVTGQLVGAFSSVSAFRDYLFTNRETIYLLSVLALNLVSVCLIPALFHAQRGLKKTHSGWLAAGIAAFNLLLVHFGHQPRPHVPFATIAFCATVLLVLVANRVGGWKVLLAATVVSALTVGTLQSGVLIIVPYALALTSRLFYDGRFHWRELAGVSTIASVAIFTALSIALYPDLIHEYGSVILGYVSGSSSKFRLGAGSHTFSLAMFNIENIPQFVYRLRSYEPVLLTLLPLSLVYFFVVFRRRVKLLLVGTSFPLLNLVIWSLFYGTFPRIAAVLVPFMIFATAYLAEDILLAFTSKTGIHLHKLRLVVFTILLVPLALTSLRLVWVSSKPDTRSLAVEWIQENIPPGEAILLNFPLTTLLPTDETIAKQSADFPGSVGTYWQWLLGRENTAAPRFKVFNTVYWNSLDDSTAAKDNFIEREGIRYLLIRTQVNRPTRDEIILYARANGRLIHTFCPVYNVFLAELPDDMFYHAWLQVWQLERPGPFVALYDLHQAPDGSQTYSYCETRE